jgi:hypothetical protein
MAKEFYSDHSDVVSIFDMLDETHAFLFEPTVVPSAAHFWHY